ncbi:MAG TPA: GNAT family N-acetyltransferase, partial [Planctomycetota bacterium]|nr:GNAT family N-acetyltransferase [Planctomycetota bacterium]
PPLSVPSAATVTLLADSHAAGVTALARDAEFRRLWGLPDSFSPEAAVSWVRHWVRRRRDAAGVAFAVIGPDHDVVGFFALIQASRDWDSALLKGYIAPAHRRRGYGSYAVRQATAAAFKKLAVREVVTFCSVEESSWARALAKLDYVLVKTSMAQDWRDGRTVKTCYFRLARGG